MIKKTIIIILTALMVLGIVYFSQTLVTPNAFNNSDLREVESYDILEWQINRENEILIDYSTQDYSLENPYVLLDPYEMNPLSALVIFDAEMPQKYHVEIRGHDETTTLNYFFDKESGRVELPILGLYPNEMNVISIETEDKFVEIGIQTEALPIDFQLYRLLTSKPNEMELGMTLMLACFDHSYTAVIDSNAEVRAYFSSQDFAHGTSVLTLKNGHLLVTGDEFRQVPYIKTSLWEMNWLGKIFKEVEIPNGVHHDIFELSNGDILVTSNSPDVGTSTTREDVAIIVDINTGQLKETYDFRKILDENRSPYHHFDPGIINPINIDWMHMNTAIYDEEHNWIIVSSPTQSQVVAIDASTKEIRWILGPHDGYEESEYLEDFLLEPFGSNFVWSWAQHHPMILEDLDNDSNTVDILLFDNGQNRSFTKENSTLPSENYSRGVHYRIHLNTMSVEQVWSYGEELGNDVYSTFLGDANRLKETQNTLITFGGHLTQNGLVVDEIVGGVTGTVEVSSRVVEVNLDKQIVFDVEVEGQNNDSSAETYQATRIDLMNTSAYMNELSNNQGKRIGEISYSSINTELSLPNIFFGDMAVDFHKIVNEGNRLILDGVLSYKQNNYLLSQTKIVLRNSSNTYIFDSVSGLNGRFFSSIGLSKIEPGVYWIQIIGGVLEGLDTQSDNIIRGYLQTDFKITVE